MRNGCGRFSLLGAGFIPALPGDLAQHLPTFAHLLHAKVWRFIKIENFRFALAHFPCQAQNVGGMFRGDADCAIAIGKDQIAGTNT
jgi:hypothetical protein